MTYRPHVKVHFIAWLIWYCLILCGRWINEYTFFDIYGTTPHLHIVWELESSSAGHRQHFRDCVRLNAVLPNLEENVKCCYCQRFVPDILNHYFHHCDHYNDTREYFWTLVINSCIVHVGLSAYLYNTTDHDQTACWAKDRRVATKRSFYQSVPKHGKFLQGTVIYSFIEMCICTSCCNWYVCSKSSANGGNKVYTGTHSFIHSFILRLQVSCSGPTPPHPTHNRPCIHRLLVPRATLCVYLCFYLFFFFFFFFGGGRIFGTSSFALIFGANLLLNPT